MDPVRLATTAAGAVLGSMYLDARYFLRYDYHIIKSALLTKYYDKMRTNNDHQHFYYNFRDKAKATPNRVFLLFEDKSYTFLQIERASNRLAHWLLAQGVKPKDVVCMMEQNHPTFFITFFAILKINAVASIINTNLRDNPLLHCIKVADSRLFLFDPVYDKQVATVADQLDQLGVKIFAYGECTEDAEGSSALAPALNPSVLKNFTDADTSESFLKGIGPNDAAMLIYTSGTTGMPKAAIAQHVRVTNIMYAGAMSSRMKPTETTFCVLPLYHGTGLWMAFGQCLVSGGTFAFARKFSASRFWDECVQHKVTRFYYIGELCRYLLNQPPHPLERKHDVQVAYGNGLRPEIWAKFKERFNIKTVCEFYGSTEGPTGTFNYNQGEIGAGAVGRDGLLLRLIRKDYMVIRIDLNTETPKRDKNGLCIKCKPGEYGEMVILIPQDGVSEYQGYYKNRKATNDKIIRHVRTKGDMYYRTGDLLKICPDGMIYFGDRLGDTFRWHGENVATTEVTMAVSEYPGIAEANVYGVQIPNHDGRAGMVAIVPQEGVKLDLARFYHHLSQKLPRYAVPIFIRFVSAIDVTGTFKQQKVEFRNQGIDLTKVPPNEPIYWSKNGAYVPFTKEDYAIIYEGKVKL